MNSRARTIRRIIILVIVLGGLLAAWKFSTRTPTVTVTLPAGSDRAELVSTVDESRITTSGKEPVSLSSGDYLVTYFKGDQALGTQPAKVGKNPGQSISGELTSPANKLSTMLHARTDKLTPLGDGFLYINRQTRGIEFANANGIEDVSSRFELSTTPTGLDFTSYSAVINIEQGRTGDAIVTTTATVFIVKNMNDITRLPLSTQDFLNLTSSSYDAKTNRVFLLSSYKRTIYYYDLGKPDQGPRAFYTNKLDMNRLVAGGGTLIAYFDDFPSLDQAAIDAYSLTRQVAPLVFNADEGKALRTLDQYKGATQITISGSGKYMTVKKKFGITMTVSSLTGSRSHTVLAPDTNGIAWLNDDLYVARGQALWLLKPAEDLDQPGLIATAGVPLRHISASNKGIYVSSTADFTSKVVSSSTAANEELGEKLKRLNLDTKDFFISFVTVNNQGAGVIWTKGSFTPGVEEAELNAAQAQQSQRARASLGEFANSPSIRFTEEDGSVVFKYQYAAVPADGEEE